jgi:hypothetical protein
LLIFCLGVGSLAKQMMFVFFPLAVLFLLVMPGKRALLKRPVLWISGLVPLLFTLPSLWWNAHHHWITFQHTSAHFRGNPASWSESFLQLGEFIGAQLGLVTPLTFILMIVIFVQLMRRWKSACLASRYLFFFSAPPLLIFLLFSFHRDVNPNWPLVYCLAGLILLAGTCSAQGGKLFAWFKKGVLFGAVLTAGFYAGMLILPATGADITRIAPLREVSGWAEYGKRVGAVHRNLPDPQNTMLITVGHRYCTAALAFYHPARPIVYHWNDSSVVSSQYDLWPGPQRSRQNALIIVSKGSELPDGLTARFETVTKIESFEIPPGAHKPKRYNLFYGTGWKNCETK